MIQVIQKWKINFTFESTDSIEIYISDNFYTNILRKVADIGFPNPIISIVIVRVKV